MRIRRNIGWILIIVLLALFLFWQNNSIVITEIEYANSNIPAGFEGFTIVQVSDLHNKDFNGRLDKLIKVQNPDVIIVTGDLIDRRKMNLTSAIDFMKRMTLTAPVYFVSGNHEELSGEYEHLKLELTGINVKVMDNDYVKLIKDQNSVGLMGMRDPASIENEDTYLRADSNEYAVDILNELNEKKTTDFNILMSHRPELFDVYADSGIDLVFSGHAHGGQFRLPFVGGLIAPNQGLFPEYSQGLYLKQNTSMIVSRGLGNSIVPFRVFNRPEIVVVTLRNQLKLN
ncbi:metallophosphoesterase [Alkalibacter mobilis]|uniref:metallophosphoesterase n=1 Tax=Alkalibacter mobilis TaxID=2787712 RepID=UPI001A9B9165|nr:metallophosphoesterase [Alkalibacter mobilis]